VRQASAWPPAATSVMDAEELRAEQLERWERAAAGWGRRATQMRESSLAVSEWMIEHLAPEPGQTVLELAAGPGDTGFLAAARIAPGKLISSDASKAMVELARERAAEQGIENVEFKQLQLEWIDLPAASVDAVLCRWGLMLVVDPAAAAREIRRVLRPGGRVALAVWDVAERNPWATIPSRALVELSHAEPPDPNQPGPFALGSPGKLRDLLDSAGFLEVMVETVEVERKFEDADEFLAETRDLSMMFAAAWVRLTAPDRSKVADAIASSLAPYRSEDGSLVLPGRSLVATASA
jgi:SAM-dependent methyltransferase